MQNPVLLARSVLKENSATTHKNLLPTVAQRYGIKLEPYNFIDAIAGALIITDNYTVIGYNINHPPSRQRFTIAHEIGHYLLGHGTMCSVASRLVADKGKEHAANLFAAEILMPKEKVVRLAALGASKQILADFFDVSTEAVTLRLKKLKIDYPINGSAFF